VVEDLDALQHQSCSIRSATVPASPRGSGAPWFGSMTSRAILGGPPGRKLRPRPGCAPCSAPRWSPGRGRSGPSSSIH
jgi:hypothetical protein